MKDVGRAVLSGTLAKAGCLPLAALILLIVSTAAVQQPTKKAPGKWAHKRSAVYVPDTDLSRSTAGDRVQTTFRLAAEVSNAPLSIATEDVDVSVLKNIRTAYGVPDQSGSGHIAIVVAYDHPTVAADLLEFSRAFHLPQCGFGSCLEVLKPPMIVPPAKDHCIWTTETTINVEWAHAIAPNAGLILSEAESSSRADMFAAVEKATERLGALGGGQIILPWGSREGQGSGEINSSIEQQYDAVFSNKVVYFAASGDAAQVVAYPAASTKVVGVGGTIPNFDQNGKLLGEVGWSESAGGHSLYAEKPTFQIGVENTSHDHRSIPDLAMTADFVPIFGSALCSGYGDHWQLAQGTSVSVVLAGAMANAAGNQNKSTATELSNIYANRKDPARIRDIITQSPGSTCCAAGYDTYTGVGVPASRDFDAPPQSQP
jgi:subtilase family serine protease